MKNATLVVLGAACVCAGGSVRGFTAPVVVQPEVRAAGEVARAPVGDTLAEISDPAWLFEVMRHAYRWYIDERDVDAVVRAGEVVFWVRELKPALDADDRSRFGEVVLPQFSIRMRVKRADYVIPELDVAVKTDVFKIVSVEGFEHAENMPAGYKEIRANYAEMKDHLFKTRNQAAFPDGELLDRMRAALREEIAKDMAERGEARPQGVQTVYLASLSPAANEAWVFWETGRMLVRFASDIDLANPAVWAHEKLAVKTYHLDRSVVVSLDEVSGSNAFMTRSQAGRALFNCVILGKRVELQPGVQAAK